MLKLFATLAFAVALPLSAAFATNDDDDDSGHADTPLAAGQELVTLDISGRDLTMTPDRIELQAGHSYRLKISSDGEEEFELQAPDLFQTVWLHDVESGGLKVLSSGVDGFGMDDEGSFNVDFTPQKAGEYSIYAKGFEDRGLKATVEVK